MALYVDDADLREVRISLLSSFASGIRQGEAGHQRCCLQ